jgi:hypothetical protein
MDLGLQDNITNAIANPTSVEAMKGAIRQGI